MTTDNKDRLVKAELEYLGRPCWKTYGFNTIHIGVIREIRITSSWLEADVHWKTKNGRTVQGELSKWERVSNLGFEALPQFNSQNRAEITAGTPSDELTPWKVKVAEDCQGLTIQALKTVNTEEIHPHVKAPKREAQSEEANRQVNYRALLAMIDGRKRDAWHVLQLNESLKREGCNTITLPAFVMRADKFQRSFERSLLSGNLYRIEDYLRRAFNGAWHGSVNKDSIWSQF